MDLGIPVGQFHNEIDHIIFNRKYCLTDVSVVPEFYTGSDHRLLRGRFRFSRQGEKAVKFKKKSPRTAINWDLYTSLAGLWEDTVMDNIDEQYNRFVHHLHDSAKGAESLKTTKRRLSPETRVDTPACSSSSVRQLPTDVRACEAMQSSDKGGS
ncbi:unnamed protein product [Heligmosomoides polygyrus]|uniref:Endo/exonuclease/phosphatase domain-containing protein n=1 Tax=Heligmosomoides polygyrus TaxID=6339 RepID=A0A183GWM9_HELPZ|nr:unnamed protein product [Heligmosomoides polygyrus]